MTAGAMVDVFGSDNDDEEVVVLSSPTTVPNPCTALPSSSLLHVTPVSGIRPGSSSHLVDTEVANTLISLKGQFTTRSRVEAPKRDLAQEGADGKVADKGSLFSKGVEDFADSKAWAELRSTSDDFLASDAEEFDTKDLQVNLAHILRHICRFLFC